MGKFSPHIYSILPSFTLVPSVPPGLGWREKPKTVLGINFGAPHDTAVGGCHFRQNQKSIQYPSTIGSGTPVGGTPQTCSFIVLFDHVDV
jgi:hypothetical protein